MSRIVNVRNTSVLLVLLVAILSSFLALDYRGKWKEVDQRLSGINKQHDEEEQARLTERIESLELDRGIVDNPAFERIILRGTESSPSSLASLYWNTTTRELYISIHELKDLSADKQYQLWATIDGKPVDLGVFDPPRDKLLRMRNTDPTATDFTVTIEEKGGKLVPSPEAAQLFGSRAFAKS